MHAEHCAHLGDHDIAGAHLSAQPIDQPSGAIEVVEMMDCDVNSTIQRCHAGKRLRLNSSSRVSAFDSVLTRS